MQRRAIPIPAAVVLLWGLALNVSTAKYSSGTGGKAKVKRQKVRAEL